MNYPIADFLTRIRNAGAAKIQSICIQHSNIKESISNILYNQGYIDSYFVSNNQLKTITVNLKYSKNKHTITGLKLISKPSLRRYVESRNIPKVLSGMGISIISTSKGILTDDDARKLNVGGELICYIW